VHPIEDDDPVADRHAGRWLLGGESLTGRLLQCFAHVRAHDELVAGGSDDVTEHGARLDRGKLTRVADEHEPGVRPKRLDQPRHERQRNH
jgi:hypothetical protein